MPPLRAVVFACPAGGRPVRSYSFIAHIYSLAYVSVMTEPLPPVTLRRTTQSRMTQAERTRLTRTRLRESAREAFARKGIAATAVEEIARGAGYSKGAFYGNYPDKNALLLEILEDKALAEVRYWRAIMDAATDPASDLDVLAHRYDDAGLTRERAMLSAELQLEAERNPEFGVAFRRYLDGLYVEIEGAMDAIFARHGKCRPAAFDTLVVTIRLLGLGLGAGTVLGNALAGRSSPGEIMLSFIRGAIAAAPEKTARAAGPALATQAAE